jgi:hypothetical protein
MTVSNKRKPWDIPPIHFGGVAVPEASEVRLLGVSVDSKLTFRDHVRSCAKRASQRLGLMKRASRIVDAHGLAAIYKGFVRPVMEYGSVAWMCAADTYLGALDRVQRRAQRTIGDDVDLDPLAHRRRVGALSYLYKLQCCGHLSRAQNMVPPAKVPDVVVPRYNTRQKAREAALVLHPHQLQEVVSVTSLNMLQRTFPYAVIGVWNGLPPDIFHTGLNIDSMQMFKVAVHHHLRATES